jgi:GT2 family glycosyltransferase
MSIPVIGHPANAVTVVIPSHRHELVGGAIDSVRLQSFRDFQLLVNHSELWWPSKINETVLMARGLYVVVLADDDRLGPGFLAKTVALAEQTRADVVYTDYQNTGRRTNITRACEWTLENFRIRNCVPGLTALVRYEVFEALKGFDSRQTFQDWDFWFRAFQAGVEAVHLPEPLVHYHWHERMGSVDIDYDKARALLSEKHPALR